MRLPREDLLEGLPPYLAMNNLVSLTTSLLPAPLLPVASPMGGWVRAEDSKFVPEGPMGDLCKPRKRIHSERTCKSCNANGYAYGGDVVM